MAGRNLITALMGRRRAARWTVVAWSVAAIALGAMTANDVSADVIATVNSTQPKLVKIYGAGGLRGLEAYQSGFLISSDGFILTAWSYVLDSDPVTVTLYDGQRFDARLWAADPVLEIALLKIDVPYTDYFDLDSAVALDVGERVLAFSNLYGIATGDELVSVQRGVVTGITRLNARRGTYQSPYHGKVYVVDAMSNNAGAAGGALTNWNGQLAGLLGKELRNNLNGIWLNYAIPISELRESVRSMSAHGKPATAPPESVSLPPHPWTIALLGLRLVPDVLSTTPPYIEEVLEAGPAAKASLQPDDLITFVNDRLVRSQREFFSELQQVPEHEPLTLVVLRGQQLVTAAIEPAP
jgi:serine protease Do